jgi:hypothetical protein
MLTIDDDVAVQLERLRRSRGVSLKVIFNQALRRGLGEMTGRPKKRTPFRTRTFSMGERFRTEPIEGVRPLLDNLDNIAEVIAYAEGEDFK